MPWRSTPRHPPPSTRPAPAAASSRASTAAATGAPSTPGWAPHAVASPWRSTPQSPSTLYASSSGVGVFKSIDGGGNWSAVNTGLDTTRCCITLGIDPQTPAILYAGATDAVFKSTDGGGSWHPTGLTKPGFIFIAALAIDPQAPATLYARTYSSGVFKSTDGGVTWSAVNTGPSNLSVGVRHLAIDPQTPNTLYASNGGDVFKSTDGASSWGWRAKARWLIGALAVDPQTPANVYAGTGDDFSAAAGGIFKSTDYLDSWSWNPSSGLTGSVKYVTALVFDPQTPTTLYAGMWTTYYGPHAGGVSKRTDGGTSWNATGLNNLRGGIGFTSGLAIDPQTPTTLYATSGSYGGSLFIGGVFQSTHRGGGQNALHRPPAL